MANIAFNIAFIYSYEEGKGQEVVKYFMDNFKVVDEPEDEDVEEGCFEITFDSRWATPKKELEDLIEKFIVTIVGVSYERGNSYVSCWNFTSKKTADNRFRTDIKLYEL